MAKGSTRPGIITLLGVLGYISGTVKVLTGLVIVLDKNRVEAFAGQDFTNTTLLWGGIITMLLGAFTLFLANSVLAGQKWSQVWYGIVFTLNMIIGFITVFTHNGAERWAGLVSAIIAFVVLQLLFNDRSQEYFDEK